MLNAVAAPVQVGEHDRAARFDFAKQLHPGFHEKIDIMIDQFDVPIPLKTKATLGGLKED